MGLVGALNSQFRFSDEIVAALGNHVANTSSRVDDVTSISRDDMDM
jgi:hypothetical protein